jgi:hypothetical protein
LAGLDDGFQGPNIPSDMTNLVTDIFFLVILGAGIFMVVKNKQVGHNLYEWWHGGRNFEDTSKLSNP